MHFDIMLMYISTISSTYYLVADSDDAMCEQDPRYDS